MSDYKISAYIYVKFSTQPIIFAVTPLYIQDCIFIKLEV